jgi:hypothetical protein
MTQAAPASPPRTTLASLGFTARVLDAQRLGKGLVAWLRVEPVASHVGLLDGLAGFVVEETGTVARLRARNRTKTPVLVPSDTVVGGGWQTRVVERSVVIAGGAEAVVPVRCVEQHRWGGARRDFSVEGTTSAPTRAQFARMKDAALRSGGPYGLDQGAVWRRVRDELAASRVTSPTESYADLLRRPPPARAPQTSPLLPEGANGALVVHGEGTVWIEAFASDAHLRARAPALVEDAGSADSRRGAAADAGRLLDEAWQAELLAVDAVEGTLGDAMALRGERVAGGLLLIDHSLVHLGASIGVPL